MTLACIFADIVFTAIIGLPFLLVTAFLLNHLRSFKDLPPGPWALPFVGYTIFFSKKPQVALTNLSKKHGHIFSVNIGTETVIVLSSYKIIKEALINQANSFSHRVDFKNIKSTIVSKDKLIATLDDGKDFAFSILGDANFQKTVIESQITDEVKCLITTMKFHGGCLQEMDQLIQQSTTNAMCGVFTGHRFDYKDDVLQDILKLLVEMSKTVNLLSWKKALSINIGKFVTSTHAEKIDYMSELTKVMSKIVAKNERELKSGRENTFINVWLAEIEKQGMKIKNHLHRHSLKRQLAGLVITNYVFQTNTLLWGLMFLTKHPEIQLKVQNEIDIIIGKERIPTITDIEQMPYVRATILEIIRMRPILSLHFSYSCIKNTRIDGQFVPKGITVLPNLWAVYHDTHIFSDPATFKPDRFFMKQQEEFFHFSLVQPMAMMELFLYFTLLLQTFTFKNEPGTSLNFDSDLGIPKTVKLYALVR